MTETIAERAAKFVYRTPVGGRTEVRHDRVVTWDCNSQIPIVEAQRNSLRMLRKLADEAALLISEDEPHGFAATVVPDDGYGDRAHLLITRYHR